MPVASLPSPYLTGDFGEEALAFAKLLKKNGFRIWQVLPLNPLGYGNSPYQCYSSKALDELYVSPQKLYDEGLIEHLPPKQKSRRIRYQEAKALKRSLLQEAFQHFQSDEAYERFAAESWVQEYAIFVTFKEASEMKCWTEWKKELKDFPLTRSPEVIAPYLEEVRYHIFAQYILYKQFRELKKELEEMDIRILGDLPFYVGIDSDDVYYNREQFLLNEDGSAKWIAGVPPDYFSKTGQRWGNPIYDWEKMREDGYRFWFERLEYSASLYDILRVDHFRAFDTYWKIDAREETAVNGEWVENSGRDFSAKLFAKYPEMHIIAEDLGDIRPEVNELRDEFSLPGMKVMEFDFFGGSRPLQIAYTGTHDNETLRSWLRDLPPAEKKKVRKFIRKRYPRETLYNGILQYTLDLKSDLVILPVTDILGEKQRINFPGTIGSPNWEYKLSERKGLEKKLHKLQRRLQRSRR